MDDWTVNDDGNDNVETVDDDTNDATNYQGIQTADGRRGLRRRGRSRPVGIGEEIELYCNPFVEVYGRLSNYMRRVTRRWIEKVVEVMVMVEENIVWREVLYVVDHTAW